MDAQSKPPISTTPADSSAARPRIESEEILRGNSTVEIEHAGQRYLLRVTRENKLILTK
ncbi:MAG: hemin uptake protein HemP [Sphingomonadaceae bacterium]|jgi:hemin uptake protein HemP